MTRGLSRSAAQAAARPPRLEAWLDARWGELCGAIAAAPAPWASWAREQLTTGPIGAGLLARLGWDAAEAAREGALDRARDPRTRTALGQVFTPAPIADLLARIAGCGADDPGGLVLDPACGAGSLLLAALRARRSAGWGAARALAAVEGWDRDPVAAWGCRAALVAWALEAPVGEVPGPLRVHVVDALGDGRPVALPDEGGATIVLSNPPYLEAKRMGRAEPGLRDRLRRRIPELGGAFDLYLAFCWSALGWTAQGGRMVFLLPNKVLQGRYAAAFRARLLADGAPVLTHVADLSRMRPRPFPGTGVYPVVLRLDRRAGGGAFRGRRLDDPAALGSAPSSWPAISLDAVRRVGGDHPIFVPFAETWPDLAPLLALPRLEEVARVASTCSFHARGLRERFVGPERPARHAHPYVGGPSRARRTEIAPFQLDWAGWWICFDQERLKAEHRNPLPDLHNTFLRPKAIFCQHGLRMRVWADLDGRYVTKDVYPVAWPTAPSWTLGKLVAVLQSTVFTALYNTLYQGIVCGGETYHYLPAFLHRVPVPPGDHPALADADAAVAALQAGPPDPARWDVLDRAVAAAYGVSEPARQRMIAAHLDRVGAERPGLAAIRP